MESVIKRRGMVGRLPWSPEHLRGKAWGTDKLPQHCGGRACLMYMLCLFGHREMGIACPNELWMRNIPRRLLKSRY